MIQGISYLGSQTRSKLEGVVVCPRRLLSSRQHDFAHLSKQLPVTLVWFMRPQHGVVVCLMRLQPHRQLKRIHLLPCPLLVLLVVRLPSSMQVSSFLLTILGALRHSFFLRLTLILMKALMVWFSFSLINETHFKQVEPLAHAQSGRKSHPKPAGAALTNDTHDNGNVPQKRQSQYVLIIFF